MTFLPIVDRELRVAARRPASFWLRVAAAGMASLIGCVFLAMDTISFGRLGAGRYCFTMLAWLAFLGAAAAGLFFTSDSLSEERREGTLGFLFLTDLRGYDVVLGKMAAATVRLLYGLLAVFPVMAVAFLMGGVTAGEFWRTLLALVNALLFSLAAGLAVSAWSDTAEGAFGGTLALLGLAVIGLPLLDRLLQVHLPAARLEALSLVSPYFAFQRGLGNTPAQFFASVGLTFLLTLGLLLLAAGKTARGWRVVGEAGAARRWARPSRSRRNPCAPLDAAPLEWLCHRLGGALDTRLITGLALPLPLLWLAGDAGVGASVAVWLLLALVLELRIGMEAAQFMVAARQSGLLGLLLAAPLKPEAVPLALVRTLRRRFLPPAAALLVVFPAGALCVAQLMNADQAAWSEGAMGAALIAGVNLMWATDFWAAAWLGMFMGLNSRNATMALLKTFLFVNVPTLPFLLFCPLPPILMLKDVGLVGYARSELFTRLRDAATGHRMNLLPPPPVAGA